MVKIKGDRSMFIYLYQYIDKNTFDLHIILYYTISEIYFAQFPFGHRSMICVWSNPPAHVVRFVRFCQ